MVAKKTEAIDPDAPAEPIARSTGEHELAEEEIPQPQPRASEAEPVEAPDPDPSKAAEPVTPEAPQAS